MPGLNVVSFYGPMLMGVFVSLILYGILVLQIWNYFQNYKRDHRNLKLFVLYLLIVETAESLIAMGIMFEPLIVENGKPAGTTMLPYLLPCLPIMDTLVSTPVHLFTAWRIYVITQSYWMPILISMISLTSFGTSFYSMETTAKVKMIAHKSKLTHPYFLLTAAATDILITATLIYSLNKRRSQARSQTDVILRKIMRWSLQTGSLTTAFTLAEVIAIYTSPKTAISFAFDFPIPKLYSNALLSTLNARSRLSRIAANLTPDEETTFRNQARNTGLYTGQEEEDDNPLFLGGDSSLRKRAAGSSSGLSSTRYTKSTGTGAPLTYARPTVTTATTTDYTTSTGEIHELDSYSGKKGKGLLSTGSIHEIKEQDLTDALPALRG